MTTVQRDAIAAPAVGLLIFNTTTNCFNFYKGSNWFEEFGDELHPPAALGSTFTTYKNSLDENFSANSTCQNKLISAGYSPATCSGNLVVGNTTYPLVLINGQCWIQTNLKEAPTAPCADAINTGCNVWLNTSPGFWSWGYFNATTTNGTAGWGATEPAVNQGLLYQWSAAMNGSTTERAQGVCPSGWHIPSDCEWMYLEHGQGMSIAEQTKNDDWRNTTGEGLKLKAVGTNWNNSSGFTALFAGFRGTDGTFFLRGSDGYWWTSSQTSATLAHRRGLNSSQPGVNRNRRDTQSGFSVRCLKD